MGMGTLYVMGEIVAPPKKPGTRVANGLGKGVSSWKYRGAQPILKQIEYKNMELKYPQMKYAIYSRIERYVYMYTCT